MVLNRCERVLRGKGLFVRDGQLGEVLQINCADASGSFELMLKASEWKGEIQEGSAFGSDYLIRLALSG